MHGVGENVIAGSKVLNPWSHCLDDAGDIHVLKASPDYQVLVHNSLPGEKIQASPAVADGQIFIRSHKHLWCIGRKP